MDKLKRKGNVCVFGRFSGKDGLFLQARICFNPAPPQAAQEEVMRYWIRGKVTVIGLILGTFWPMPASAQPQTSPGQDAAGGLFARPRPFLEEALGYRLNGPPSFRTVNAAQLQEIADTELDVQLRWQFPGLAESVRTQASAAASDAFRAVSVALYRSGNEILLPANSPRLAQWAEYQTPAGGNPVAFRKDFATLALVLEAARMALDQRYQLTKRWAACRSRDEFDVLEALYEGQALWLTRRVARRLSLDACFLLLTDRLDCVLRRPADVSFDDRTEREALSDRELYTLCWLVLRERHRTALFGLGFFDYLEKQGIRDAADRAFAQPPSKLAWVEHPELYCKAELRTPGSLAYVLDQLGDRFKNDAWDCRLQPWTPEMVRQVAVNLGAQEQVERVLHSWQDGAALLYVPKTEGAEAEVALGVVRLTDAAGARAYFGLSSELQRKQDELLNTRPNSPQRVAKSETHTLPLAGADEAVRTDKEFQPAEGRPARVTTLLVRSGNLVALFTWRELAPDPDWASRFLAELLADSGSGSGR